MGCRAREPCNYYSAMLGEFAQRGRLLRAEASTVLAAARLYTDNRGPADQGPVACLHGECHGSDSAALPSYGTERPPSGHLA